MMGVLLPDTPYSTAKFYFLSAAFWGIAGTCYGFIAALSLVAPDLISSSTVMLTFGRLRPIHVNLVAYAFVFSLLLGAASYYVPRLCKREGLANERLGVIAVWIWNFVFVATIISLHMGHTQARELAELIWGIDVFFAGSLALFALNIFWTIAQRKQRLLYVSIWYAAGGITWTLTVYFIGNIMWLPPAGALTGLMDSIWLWFYGHNVVGLILTPMAVGAAYWVLPRAINRPVWSHTMSLIGFWVLLVVYTHTGTHHLIQAPVPQWLKVISIVDSFALLIPVFTVLLNLWLPMRGRLGVLHENHGARFVFLGTIWYAIVCVQGPLQSLPGVQKLTHFTHWVVAHSHIAILGFAGFIGIGATYVILPLVTKKPLYSRTLANLSYWIIFIGLFAMFIVLTIAGLIQGGGWLNGEAFYRIVTQLHLYMLLRAMSGLAIIIGIVIFSYNVWRTALQRVPSETAASQDGRPAVQAEAA